MTYTFETSLAVADYEGDFDDCQEAVDDARESAIAHMRDVLGAGELPTIVSIEFCEFDSSNPGHANAYFEVTVEGDEDAIAKLEAEDE